MGCMVINTINDKKAHSHGKENSKP